MVSYYCSDSQLSDWVNEEMYHVQMTMTYESVWVEYEQLVFLSYESLQVQ